MTEISFMLPTRNEEKTIGICIKKIQVLMQRLDKSYEIIVSDSSHDKSPEIAKKLGAKVIKHDKKGYGVAYIEALQIAKGKILVMGDADNTYDFGEAEKLLKYIDRYDIVIGRREKLQKGAMPFMHRYLGNPLLSFILRLFFQTKIRDAHSGFRAIRKEDLQKLELMSTGMEFSSEMIIKAVKNGLKIKEVPVSYCKREGTSKLKTFSDGWRHMRFMLIYAPNYLFLIPGAIFFAIGAAIIYLFLSGPVKIGEITLYTYPALIGSFMAILGYQIFILGIFAKTYALSSGFEKKDILIGYLAKIINFESGIIMGMGMLLLTAAIGSIEIISWIGKGYPSLQNNNVMILILTLGILSIQTLFSALYMSILLIEKNKKSL